MMVRSLAEFLMLGWSLADPPDICWLDCARSGILERRRLGLIIVLCAPHAEQLERGFFRGDYSGSPLPPESRAMSWPWQSEDDLDRAA